MFQPSTEICLKGLALLLAAGDGAVVQSREIGARLGISPAYVTKALQPLARRGWLRSMKGRVGGWRVVVDPTAITLEQLVDVLEPERQWERCVAGHVVCADETACPFHEIWSRTVRQLMAVMRATTIDHLDRFLPPDIDSAARPTRRRARPRRTTAPRGQPRPVPAPATEAARRRGGSPRRASGRDPRGR